MAKEAWPSRSPIKLAANNFIAIEPTEHCARPAWTCRGDVSLVAFDDLPPNFSLELFLTVVAQRAYDMGQTATRQLLNASLKDPATNRRRFSYQI